MKTVLELSNTLQRLLVEGRIDPDARVACLGYDVVHDCYDSDPLTGLMFYNGCLLLCGNDVESNQFYAGAEGFAVTEVEVNPDKLFAIAHFDQFTGDLELIFERAETPFKALFAYALRLFEDEPDAVDEVKRCTTGKDLSDWFFECDRVVEVSEVPQ